MEGFRRVPSNVDLPALDGRILAIWDEIDAFERSIEQRPEENSFTFYDGPPFATGSPHYGHILVGVIKDIVPRYWTMRGHRIERRFGWDTHGLPVEMEVEKQLGISGPRQIADYGVDRYNEACRVMVNQTTEEWEDVTRRIGRWIDFENDYKTMDPEFMESVWWVFKRLWDKGLIYRDFKVLPYSWGATTPLSNFEANMDYRDVDDPAITVRLKVIEGTGRVRAGDWLLIWTTTPWTLPGNLAVAVGPDIDYACVRDDSDQYWIAESLVDTIWPEGAEVIAQAKGSDMIGSTYRPPFDYFGEERDRGAFRVIASDETSTEEGTGLVHMAPAYGEVDFYALQAAGLNVLVDPVDAEARFTNAAPDVAGMYVKDADSKLIDLLKVKGLLVKRAQIRHSYPFCWRTETPLIYKAIPTWFVRVEQFKDRMVELNKNIHWVPGHVGEKRFGNWLEGARDWAISRNRYWGSCIPVWECPNGHTTCVGSIDELETLSGVRVDDLHKHFVDPVTFPCPDCEQTATRVPEVLDCWFESGSMPYAQPHYPFENREWFEANFPANFINESLDQTRGWFYTLVVLAAALFDREPFQNCIVSGMILAEDGRKMSKSLKNYPDPSHILDTYGADALRAYLIDSPLMRAESLRFSESGVREVVRTVLLPLWNAFSFFTTYAEADGITMTDLRSAPQVADRPELDRWLLSVLQSLIENVNTEMEGYYLYNVVGPTLSFIDDLTNWYIRRSRRRFWRSRLADDADKVSAFATLYEALTMFSKVLAPVLPFVTEQLHQELVVAHDADAPASVHLADYPIADAALIDRDLESSMASIRSVVRLGHNIRKQHALRVRQPLSSITVLTRDPSVVRAVETHIDLITDELNVKQVMTSEDEGSLVDLTARANFKALGPRLGKEVKAIDLALAEVSSDDLHNLQQAGTLTVEGHELSLEDVVLQRTPKHGVVVAAEGTISVAMDIDLDEALIVEGFAREIINRVQTARRDLDLDVTDRVTVRWSTGNASLEAAFLQHEALIIQEVLATELVRADIPETIDLAGARLGLDVGKT
ncbi:MAG: isoleucine--tRNA ligase [Acidimicrobiia bacterium]